MSEAERHAKRAAIAQARISIQADMYYAQGRVSGLREAEQVLAEMLEALEQEEDKG